MKKRLTFDARKYIQISIWKLLLLVLIFGLFILISALINQTKFSINDYKSILVLLAFFEVIYAGRLYLNYKYYRDSFECKFKENYFSYSIVRFPSFLESFSVVDDQSKVNVEATRLDKVEKKFGKIIIYGKMTMEKNFGKNKVKIIDKFSFPDYCVGEEELMKLVNKQ